MSKSHQATLLELTREVKSGTDIQTWAQAVIDRYEEISKDKDITAEKQVALFLNEFQEAKSQDWKNFHSLCLRYMDSAMRMSADTTQLRTNTHFDRFSNFLVIILSHMNQVNTSKKTSAILDQLYLDCDRVVQKTLGKAEKTKAESKYQSIEIATLYYCTQLLKDPNQETDPLLKNKKKIAFGLLECLGYKIASDEKITPPKDKQDHQKSIDAFYTLLNAKNTSDALGRTNKAILSEHRSNLHAALNYLMLYATFNTVKMPSQGERYVTWVEHLNKTQPELTTKPVMSEQTPNRPTSTS